MRGLDPERRARIVEYARRKLGTPHDDRGWQRDVLTYGLGLPVVPSPGKISCHGLVYEAYGSVGIEFRHQIDHMPWFNLARWVGHPLGHPADKVNSKSAYLRDHHLYADNRFDVALSIRRTDDDLTIVHNPAKFSWLAAPYAGVPEGAPEGIRGRVLTKDRDFSLVSRAG